VLVARRFKNGCRAQGDVSQKKKKNKGGQGLRHQGQNKTKAGNKCEDEKGLFGVGLGLGGQWGGGGWWVGAQKKMPKE